MASDIFLITGVAGYIGSQCALTFLQSGFSVIGLDDFRTGCQQRVKFLQRHFPKQFDFLAINLCNSREVGLIDLPAGILACLHFAGLKDARDSISDKGLYLSANVASTRASINICKKFDIKCFIFSSSASVYGENLLAVRETDRLDPATPYALSKVLCEREIRNEFAIRDSEISFMILRYFNPYGVLTHQDIPSEFEDNSSSVTSVIRNCLRDGGAKFVLNGADFPTRDGGAIRDFIHIEDLILAHTLAVESMIHSNGMKIMDVFNVGYGIGLSIVEIINVLEGKRFFDWEVGPRISGEIPVSIADVSKLTHKWGWDPKHTGIEPLINYLLGQ